MNHRDIAIRLLVGRSSWLIGQDWPLAEDQSLQAQERALWAAMTETERLAEQAWLREFWGHRGKVRELDGVPIPDEAFSLTLDGGLRAGRPRGLGSGAGALEQWLWSRGFQPLDVGADRGVVSVGLPRFMADAERLAGLLERDRPLGRGWKVRGIYDPGTGQAVLEVTSYP